MTELGGRFVSCRWTLAAIAVAGVAATAAQAQTLTLASDSPGSTMNTVASGIAKVVTEGGSVRPVVRPFAGPDAYMEAFDNGELHLAVYSSVSAWGAMEGETPQKKKFTNMRLLRSSEGGLRLTFVVLKESGIKTISDLKGKRVTSDFGGHATIPKSIAASLATVGLTWDDVRRVPVPGAVDGVRAVGDRRVDASWASLGMPQAREVHAKSPVRYLPFENSPKALETLRKMLFPGVQLIRTQPNPAIGLDDEATLITYDTYLVAHKSLDDKTATAILEAMWNKTDDLVKIHASLAGFTREAAVTDIPMLPYHPAAIAFYKTKGAWNETVAAANAKFR
jgi:TRAP transporter TAXI family solute receptor